MNTLPSKNYSQFKKVHAFLMRYFSIWEKEVLNYYPESYESFPSDWVKEIQNLSEKEKWLVDSKKSFSPIKNKELANLFNEINNLRDFLSKKFEQTSTYRKECTLNIKERTGLKIKKQHEIEQLISFIQEEKSQNSMINGFIDIGGGKGHLSRLLAQKLNLKGVCLEMNPDFVTKGKALIKEQDVTFSCAHLPEKDIELSKKILLKNRTSSQDLCLGLHTCGPLANTIIQACVGNKQAQLLNFGCCYLKLSPGQSIGISNASKKYPLPLSKYALTLATRAHTGLTWEDYVMKRKVKSFRYGIHLFLYDVLGKKQFINVGDGKKQNYQGAFSVYVLSKLSHLGIQCQIKASEIDQWFLQKEVQQKIDEMFCMNIIRWQFGRAIELWILLDRACYLEERGYETKLGEYFNENISPRNIGIYAKILSNEKHL